MDDKLDSTTRILPGEPGMFVRGREAAMVWKIVSPFLVPLLVLIAVIVLLVIHVVPIIQIVLLILTTLWLIGMAAYEVYSKWDLRG
jgi:lipopolysaccharide export LptBFGC system permease protein LptF